VKYLVALGLFLLGGTAAALAWEYGIKGSIERSVRAEVNAEKNDAGVAKAESVVVQIDTVYRTEMKAYPVFRDRIIEANSDNKPLQELAKRCDAILTTCQQRVAAANDLADSLRKQVADLKAQKKVSPPRFSAFTEALYDVLAREPVLRAGGDMRLVGPLSLMVAGEASAGMNESRQRVLAGLRFTFK
jgi:hypothetical protein